MLESIPNSLAISKAFTIWSWYFNSVCFYSAPSTPYPCTPSGKAGSSAPMSSDFLLLAICHVFLSCRNVLDCTFYVCRIPILWVNRGPLLPLSLPWSDQAPMGIPVSLRDPIPCSPVQQIPPGTTGFFSVQLNWTKSSVQDTLSSLMNARALILYYWIYCLFYLNTFLLSLPFPVVSQYCTLCLILLTSPPQLFVFKVYPCWHIWIY